MPIGAGAEGRPVPAPINLDLRTGQSALRQGNGGIARQEQGRRRIGPHLGDITDG